MTVLLLRLSGPLQAWGSGSRFVRRMTEREPTKSGVIGLIASAMGRSREDSLEDLSRLEFGVRVDQRGRLLRDFQTERSHNGKMVMPLSHRYYLADAKFLVALSGDNMLLEHIDQALSHPCWPLYLGRRSCPPDSPISMGLSDEYVDVREAIKNAPWIAAQWYRKRHDVKEPLEAFFDAREDETGELRNDIPISFSSEGRRYSGRRIVRCLIDNPDAGKQEASSDSSDALLSEHDPFSFL